MSAKNETPKQDIERIATDSPETTLPMPPDADTLPPYVPCVCKVCLAVGPEARGPGPSACPTCDGWGSVPSACPTGEGWGSVRAEVCTTCNGTGQS